MAVFTGDQKGESSLVRWCFSLRYRMKTRSLNEGGVMLPKLTVHDLCNHGQIDRFIGIHIVFA
jgi:hypothetical protein